MSADVAQSTSVIFEGIAALSQLGIAVATALIAWVAYVAFVSEEQTKRDALERKENRKIIGKIVSSTVAFEAKVERSNPVSVASVNNFVEELAAVEGAIGIARAHGLNSLVDSANAYVRAVKKWRRAMELAKDQRPEEQRQGMKRPQKYADALDRAYQQYRLIAPARDKMFQNVNSVLGIEVSRSTSAIVDYAEEEDF